MSAHPDCDWCTETAAVVRREVAALTAERDEARAKLDALRKLLSPETTKERDH